MSSIRALQGTSTALLISLLCAPAATFTNAPSADTYFEAYGSEDTNFGTSPVLRIDQWGGRQIFLHFPLTKAASGARISSATLRLNIIETGLNEAGPFPELSTCFGVFPVLTPWTEGGLTFRVSDGVHAWHQGPGIGEPRYTDLGPLTQRDLGPGNPAVALNPARVTPGLWLELDVTSFVRAQVRAGCPDLNLVLRASTLGRNFIFHSREANDSTLRPQLLLQVEDQTPDFAATYVLRSDWTPGATVSSKIKSRSSSVSRLVARLVRKPATSTLSESSVVANRDSFELKPDTAGRYQLELAHSTQSTNSAVDVELNTIDVLAVKPHPRLYVDAQNVARMRDEARSGARLTAAFLNWVVTGTTRAADGRFHDMGLHEGCENASLAWLITGNRTHLTNAILYAKRILQKPMREHFQTSTEATFTGAAWVHAMAVHYDWCYDSITSEHRERVADWLKEAAEWAAVRSGAPIAHNDGGARQCLLASAALALLGDVPYAESLYRVSRDNFDANLLPWLNDGGREDAQVTAANTRACMRSSLCVMPGCSYSLRRGHIPRVALLRKPPPAHSVRLVSPPSR
jgi:hypothetical protein